MGHSLMSRILQTVHDGSNPAEVNRFLMAGGYMSASGRFQGVLEPSRTVGDVDVKADGPKGCIASFPEVCPHTDSKDSSQSLVEVSCVVHMVTVSVLCSVSRATRAGNHVVFDELGPCVYFTT